MIRDLCETAATTCEASECDRQLTEPQLVFETEAGRREAYECVCGAVTVPVARSESAR